MMKVLFPSILILYKSKMKSTLILLPLLILISIMMYLNNPSITNYSLKTDSLSLIMILLTLMTSMLISLSMDPKSFPKSILLILSISLTLMFTFSMSKMFNFYVMFEIVLIPTLILITKSGKQPERLQAGIYLMIYTITASLPLLMSILSMKNNMSFTASHTLLNKFNLSLFLMLAFLAKTPMFFTHLWLPKAHVEAPLEGSMILAAILLKLGGYGLIRFLPICYMKISLFSSWMMSISLMGAISTSLNCIRQKDMKALIAYSSVAHMGLTLCGIFTLNNLGLLGSIVMMIAHGLSSSALFFLVNDLYIKLHSRNIILFKGLTTLTPNITLWWFLFMSINISAPPSINTLSEIFIMSSLMIWSSFLILPLIISSISAASFSFSLFINSSHNKNEMLPFPSSKQKTYLSLFTHLTPLILMIMKMETMHL